MTALRDFTSARVGLGLAGNSLPLAAHLELRLAHARARDAVHFPLDSRSLMQEVEQRRWSARILNSTAANRQEYLQRPDKGRVLEPNSVSQLHRANPPHPLTFVIADGLSALAVHRHALPLLDLLFGQLDFAPADGNPLLIVHQGRVAIADHIGELTGTSLSVLLIGERPGLSSPDSLGVYLTWKPTRGRTDAERNCVSNIHACGLSYGEAAHRLVSLIRESSRRHLTGIALKESAGKFLDATNQ